MPVVKSYQYINEEDASRCDYEMSVKFNNYK